MRRRGNEGWNSQCSGKRLSLELFDLADFLCLFGSAIGVEVAVIPVDVLVFLPAACGCVDAVAKVVLG